MASQFLSSEEYDERAHQLYNAGQIDEAFALLKEGLALYPASVELHVGMGYAWLAREEYAWARRSFEEALLLDSEHEDALAGIGETLLRFGQVDHARTNFRRILELGYHDDVELMLQVGRALFRDGLVDDAQQFFNIAVQQQPDSAEAVSCMGYAEHRLGEEDAAVSTLRRALKLDPAHAEARIYLANVLYDKQEFEAALYHFDKTQPEEHWDELGIWRLIELKKAAFRLSDDDTELQPWVARVDELQGESTDIDELLAEIEARVLGEDEDEPADARGQLELFGALLAEMVDQKQKTEHTVVTRSGDTFTGDWDDLVRQMRDVMASGRSTFEFMLAESKRVMAVGGHHVPTESAEAFIRGCIDAGVLRLVTP
jgi:Tfp pilus assembly protein PilF